VKFKLPFFKSNYSNILLHTKKRAGFTLVEIMIAISIIAILSTVGLSVYTQGQKLARDAKRKADLKQIQTALNLYYQDFKAYPNTVAGACSSNLGGFTQCVSSGAAPWINGLNNNYLDIMPVDPVANNGDTANPKNNTNFGYGYRVYVAICNKGANQVYTLYAKLENSSDPDRLAAKNHLWCDGAPLKDAPHSWHDDLYVLSSYF
jgi:prepilin-type N-terminal cleavage/methylation domain-containing protein